MSHSSSVFSRMHSFAQHPLKDGLKGLHPMKQASLTDLLSHLIELPISTKEHTYLVLAGFTFKPAPSSLHYGNAAHILSYPSLATNWQPVATDLRGTLGAANRSRSQQPPLACTSMLSKYSLTNNLALTGPAIQHAFACGRYTRS